MSTNKRIRTYLQAALFLLSVSFLLCACQQQAPAEEFYVPEELTVPDNVDFETVPVELGEFVLTSTGRAAPTYLEKVTLKWEGGSVRFAQVHVKANEYVTEGQVLMTFNAEIDNTQLLSLRMESGRSWEAFNQEKASRQAAIEAQKQKAQQLTSYDQRIAELTAERMQAEYDIYVFQTLQSLYSLDAQIFDLEAKANVTTLVAPFSGVIDSVTSFNEGDPVSNGKSLVTMHAIDKLLIKATDSSNSLRYNMPISILSGSGSKMVTYEGRVVAAPNILPTGLSQDTVLVKLDLLVTPDELSRSLQYEADVQVVQNVLVTSRDALNNENGKDFVYVLEDGEEVKKYVIAKRSKTDTVWILEGLSEGQTLILD